MFIFLFMLVENDSYNLKYVFLLNLCAYENRDKV